MKRKLIAKSLLILTLIVFLAVPIIAATTLTAKQATVYTGTAVIVNGKALDYTNTNGTKAEAIAVDGVTYLPLRAMADTVGMEVTWDNETKTAKLTNKTLKKGTLLYEDDKVAISFENITSKKLSYVDTTYYYINCIVTNKTEVELTFQTDAISINGWSYGSLSGSDDIAKNSTGRIQFQTTEEIPTTVTSITGDIRVIDFSETVIDWSYDAGFNVTVK